MAESADDNALYWVEPEFRGILPLDRFHISRSLRKTVRQQRFEIRIDTAFADVIEACAAKDAGAHLNLDQSAESARCTGNFTGWEFAIRSKPGKTASWSAGSTA